MELTLGKFVDEQDEKRQALLRQEISRAEAKSGRSFDNVRIKSAAEMGEAAGRCYMCTKEIEVREDIVATEEGIRGHLAATLVHEGIHAEGVHYEGLTELFTTLETGTAPVPAYATKVDHARHVADIIGRDETKKLAKSPNAQVLLLRNYVQKKVQWGMDVRGAQEEGQHHLRLAA